MGSYEFDQEQYDRVLWEGGEAIGMEKGIEMGKMGIRIYGETMRGEADTERIAESIGSSIEGVENVRKRFEI